MQNKTHLITLDKDNPIHRMPHPKAFIVLVELAAAEDGIQPKPVQQPLQQAKLDKKSLCTQETSKL